MTSPNPIIPIFSPERQKEAIVIQYQKSIEALAEVGRLLLEAQKHLDKSFDSFVGGLPFSRRSAYHFITIYTMVQKYGATVAQANVTLAAWYITPPEDEALVSAIIEKSKQGQKVTVHDVRALLSTVNFNGDDRQALAWHSAAESNPSFVAESFKRGAMPVNGLDMPLDAISPEWIEHAADEDKKERVLAHIQAKEKPMQKITISLECQRIDGEFRLVIPKEHTDSLIGLERVTILYSKGESL
jgi:hypothetical protein